MSTKNPSKWDFYWDMGLVVGSLPFGRLLPTLSPPKVDLTGRVAIVTGANSGIGYHIALELYGQGATVYMACRSEPKAKQAISEIKKSKPASSGALHILILDTSSLSSVREAANRIIESQIPIHLLLHNAGIGTIPDSQPYSPDGFPIQYATNLLGSFLFTQLVEQNLTDTARVIFTSSTGSYSGAVSSSFSLSTTVNRVEPGFHVPVSLAEKDNTKKHAPGYANTKAMQVAFAKLLQARFDRQAKESPEPGKKRKVAHAFSPGFTSTAIFGEKTIVESFWDDPLFWLLKATSEVLATDISQGSATGVWLATTEDDAVIGEGMGGGYWDRMTRRINKVDLWRWEKLERMWIRWEADAGIEWR